MTYRNCSGSSQYGRGGAVTAVARAAFGMGMRKGRNELTRFFVCHAVLLGTDLLMFF